MALWAWLVALLLLGTAPAAPAPPPAAATGGWNTPSLDSLPASDLMDLGGTGWSVHATAGPGAHNCSATAKLKASVPGDIYTDLHAAGTIGDPLAAFGDWKTAWAGRTSWTYSRSFEVDAARLSSSGEALLVFEGIETNATVSVNGKPVSASARGRGELGLPIAHCTTTCTTLPLVPMTL